VGRTTVTLDGSLTDSADPLDAVRRHLFASGIVVLPNAERPEGAPVVLVLDAVTPRALRHLASITEHGRHRVLVVVTDQDGLCRGDGWRLVDHGAADVRVWRPGLEDQLNDRLHRWAAVSELIESDTVREELVGSSPCWLAALDTLVEVARFSASAILITGESGTGKELAARLVHHLDPRVVRGRLVVVDCTTVVPSLSGSEFFGHERGAFTGAHSAREGAFSAAHGGTLFLDEVGELPLPLQAELLRVVQEGAYKRVGGNDWLHTSFRLVCATNRNLLKEVEQSRFRADLYYRIAVATVSLPPLRDRAEDILPLFRHFVRAVHGADLEIDTEVANLVEGRTYPGNVRDLRQLALRMLTRHAGTGPITVGDVPEEERPRVHPMADCSPTGSDDRLSGRPPHLAPRGQPTRDQVIEEVGGGWSESDLDAIVGSALDRGIRYDDIHTAVTMSAQRVALERAGGNQKRAAELLGLTPRALQKQRQRVASPLDPENPP
jgi:transcriptional regulator with GAF, ATPase, and Fis domain